MRKVVIIGAGHVGSHCGYALAHSGIAGEIVLVDVDKDKAHAQALDIADSVSFCERETVVRDGDYKDCEDAALVVVAIGEARKPGQTRLDMLGRSVEMLKELLEQLKPYKIPGIVVTITNPADIVADYVRKGRLRKKQSLWNRNFIRHRKINSDIKRRIRCGKTFYSGIFLRRTRRFLYDPILISNNRGTSIRCL